MKKSLLTLFFALLVSMTAWAETTYSKALEEKAIKGDADAMLELSTCYRFAMGVKKDIDWANYWLECAAKAGSTKALTVLTSLGDNGTGLKDAKRRELDSIVQRERQKLQNDDDDIAIDYSTYNDALYRKAQSQAMHKVFDEEQWAKYLKGGAAREKKQRDKRAAKKGRL